MQKLIMFDSSKSLLAQSIMSAGIATVHGNYPTSGAVTTYKDFASLSSGDITTYIGALVANTYAAIYVALPSGATNTAHTLMNDYIAGLDANIIAANRGSVNNSKSTGTCQSNATTTNIILATTASAVDDAYKGMFIKCTIGASSTYHYCTGYSGTTKIATVADTGSAITTTSTYIVYTQPYVYVVGDASSSLTSTYTAWNTLFPKIIPPPFVSLMRGTGTNIKPHYMVTQTATSVAASSLTHTSNFTSGQFNSGSWYVAVESATTGAGQVKRIHSNTHDVLTIDPWDVLPTGSVVYQICSGPSFCLYEKYLKYSVETYLGNFTLANTITTFQQLIDMLNVIPGNPIGNAGKGSYNPTYNASLLADFGNRGKCVFDTINAGYVTA